MTSELRDTPERYGRVSRALHWSMAALFIWQFLNRLIHIVAKESALDSVTLPTHEPLGALLFLLVVIRFVWAFVNRNTRPPYPRGVLGRAAVAGHVALYALMLVVPALALLRAYGSGRGLDAFGLFQLVPATGTKLSWLIQPGRELHGLLAWVLLALIGGHVAMAIYHEKVLRDRTIARMAG